jgi:hypothetical protein
MIQRAESLAIQWCVTLFTAAVAVVGFFHEQTRGQVRSASCNT